MISVTEIHVPEEAEALVLECLRTGALAQGPRVAQLEDEFAAMCGVDHAVAVGNGTLALELALAVADLEPGDEVVTSPFTFVATVNAALAAGATVRFADIDPASFNIDADAAAAAVTDRTRALVPVHLYGRPAPMDELAALAEDRGLVLVEDSAQAHAASVGGRRTGSWGLGCFSFYATKNMTTGEGGMVTTSDAGLADRMRVLRNQGMRARYQYEVVGHNWRMTDVAASIGLADLHVLDERTEARRRHAAALSERLAGIDGLVTPGPGGSDVRHVFHQYTVRVTGDARMDRDRLAAALAEQGIGNGIYYPKVAYDYDCYRSHPDVIIEPMPEAERAASEVLSLPVHPFLSDDDLDRISEVVRSLLS
ncbi:MAG TPA: DegT/DnrJ/EryC1/StrS family aminotransferase [Microthrixaceae bacterium]|nr:DegT/DnrJ/EryC1/StrS family aminotransferase [Microthrixaceae bacterium]